LTFRAVSGRLEKEKSDLALLEKHRSLRCENKFAKAWAERITTPNNYNQGRTE
jgi:hypothetical protein